MIASGEWSTKQGLLYQKLNDMDQIIAVILHWYVLYVLHQLKCDAMYVFTWQTIGYLIDLFCLQCIICSFYLYFLILWQQLKWWKNMYNCIYWLAYIF